MRGLTLVEVLVVCIIVGILATFAVPQYIAVKERGLDRVVQAYLVSLQAAERVYKMDAATYYPSSTGSDNNPATINAALKVDLPVSGLLSWAYTVYSDGKVEAVRNDTGARTWTLNINDASPTCSGTDCKK